MDPFVAEIRIFPFNFEPRGWAFCNGQILPISQNTALFSLLGTTYGGDGRVTFALPNLQGRSAIHSGRGPGLSDYRLGQVGGTESVSLQSLQLPAHNHTVKGSDGDGSSGDPSGKVWAGAAADRDLFLYNNGNGDSFMASSAVGMTGGSQPHNNLMPYLAVNFCIALVGVYPPRS